MNTEKRELTNVEGELTDEELDRVSGGLDKGTGEVLLTALCGIPVLGAFAATARAVANAYYGTNY